MRNRFVYALIIVVAGLFFVSCNDFLSHYDPSDYAYQSGRMGHRPTSPGEAITTINGVVDPSALPSAPSVVVVLGNVVYSTTQIDSTGRFVLMMPTLPENILTPVPRSSSAYISDTSARRTWLEYLEMRSGANKWADGAIYKASLPIYFCCGGDPRPGCRLPTDSVGGYMVSFIYANMNFILIDTISYPEAPIGVPSYRIISREIYRKGWNQRVIKLVGIDGVNQWDDSGFYRYVSYVDNTIMGSWFSFGCFSNK